MTLGLAFYVIMLVWLVYGSVGAWQANGWPAWGGSLMLFALLLLLGWRVFGPPIHG